MPDRQSWRIVTIALVVWLGLACVICVTGLLERATPPGIAAIVWTLTLVVLAAAWKIEPVRGWALNVSPRWLVLFHLTRFIGFYFLFLERRGEMPAGFAIPAGWGDITVAVFAGLLLATSGARSRPLLLLWNCLGLVDILLVVFLALRIGLQDRLSMHALREWPLSLLPTFLVPAIIASHVLIFVRLRRRESAAD